MLNRAAGRVRISQSDGTLAALSFSGPTGFEGRLLYLREDLLHRYAAGRQLVLIAYGERQLDLSVHDAGDWLYTIENAGHHIWRYVWTGEQLSPRFST
jgi:hypothetical protein